MFALFNRFLDLVLMRLPPQAFPASRFLFGVTFVAYLLVSLGGNYVLSADAGYSMARAALSVFNLCAGAALILAIARRKARWQQTVIALFGGESVIGLILLPVLLTSAAGIENIFMLLSMLLFLAWELVFIAHVYRNALETGMGAGVLTAVLYVVASSVIKQQLAPFPAN
jgi:hypothetical protein